MRYWILMTLQEMANDHDQEIVVTDMTVVALIPVIYHMLAGGMWY